MQGNEHRNLFPAWGTPSCPEVDEDDLPLPLGNLSATPGQVGQRDDLEIGRAALEDVFLDIMHKAGEQ